MEASRVDFSPYRAGSEITFSDEIEVDAGYSGGHRKGNQGKGAAGKISVFGLLKQGVRVWLILRLFQMQNPAL